MQNIFKTLDGSMLVEFSKGVTVDAQGRKVEYPAWLGVTIRTENGDLSVNGRLPMTDIPALVNCLTEYSKE